LVFSTVIEELCQEELMVSIDTEIEI
jgi:hypothetical protein